MLVSMTYVLVIIACIGENSICVGEHSIHVGEYNMCWWA